MVQIVDSTSLSDSGLSVEYNSVQEDVRDELTWSSDASIVRIGGEDVESSNIAKMSGDEALECRAAGEVLGACVLSRHVGWRLLFMAHPPAIISPRGATHSIDAAEQIKPVHDISGRMKQDCHTSLE